MKNKPQEGFLMAKQAEKALKKAVKNVIAEHKLRGLPLVIWRKGKVVKIPAHQLNRF